MDVNLEAIPLPEGEPPGEHDPKPAYSQDIPDNDEDDGWVDLGSDDDDNDVTVVETKFMQNGTASPSDNIISVHIIDESKKKLEARELIQRKLLELKLKARQEAEKNAEDLKKSTKLVIQSKSSIDVDGTRTDKSEAPAPQTESERIVDELFKQFEESEAKQSEELKKTLNNIEAEISKLGEQIEEKDDGQLSSDNDDKDDSKRSKKRKKEKKSKKSKHKKKSRRDEEDPELNPDYFNVPSPTPMTEEEQLKEKEQRKSEREQKKASNSSSSSRRSDAKDYDSRRSSRDRDKRDRSARSRDRSARSQDRSRSRSRNRRRSSRERERDRRTDRNSDRHRYRDRGREHRDRDRSRGRNSGSRTSRHSSRNSQDDDSSFYIDKEKLRRIAMKRVAQMQAAGKSILAAGVTHEDLAQIKSGGASLKELTAFCHSMAKGSDEESSSDDEILNVPCTAEENDTTGMIQPFTKPAAIVMNIKNAKQLPARSAEELFKLRTTFPVSSGTHHRKDEPSEWTPVLPTDPQKKVFNEPVVYDEQEDIADLIAKRLDAVNKLKQNPNDKVSREQISAIDQKTAKWSESKNVPGAFTGVIEARMLTADELAPSLDKKQQAWLKKDTFLRARPISGGIGQFLLQKMGWQQGQGLGRQNEGSLEPLMLDFNVSRKGLTAPEERAKTAAMDYVSRFDTVAASRLSVTKAAAANRSSAGGEGGSINFTLSDKHPVSAIMEICSKRKWNPPSFEMIHESGPSHKRAFIMKVTINGVEYQPSLASSNKKEAKTLCATVALQAMGLVPRDQMLQTTEPSVCPPPPAPPSFNRACYPPLPQPVAPSAQSVAPSAQSLAAAAPPAPHLLSSVPDIDLSSFR